MISASERTALPAPGRRPERPPARPARTSSGRGQGLNRVSLKQPRPARRLRRGGEGGRATAAETVSRTGPGAV